MPWPENAARPWPLPLATNSNPCFNISQDQRFLPKVGSTILHYQMGDCKNSQSNRSSSEPPGWGAMISTFCRGFFWYAILWHFFRHSWPPHALILVRWNKKYNGIKMSAFSRNSNIQECVCGGVCLSSVIANIAKGTTDPRVEFCLPKSQVLTQILIKFQNSKSQPNISISTKLWLQNPDQTFTL